VVRSGLNTEIQINKGKLPNTHINERLSSELRRRAAGEEIKRIIRGFKRLFLSRSAKRKKRRDVGPKGTRRREWIIGAEFGQIYHISDYELPL